MLVVAILLSYDVLHDDGSGNGVSSPLRAIEIVGPEQTVFDWSRDACEAPRPHCIESVGVPEVEAEIDRLLRGGSR